MSPHERILESDPHMLPHEVQATYGCIGETALQLSTEEMSDYTTDYQPTYPDRAKLDEAKAELAHTKPVTSIENIDQLSSQLAEIAQGTSGKSLIIAGPCAEKISLLDDIGSIAEDYIKLRQVLTKSSPDSIAIQRNRGQSAKPRSQEYESDGITPSYYGDAINGQSKSDRTPDPSRMVAMAIQARDVERILSNESGGHVPAAHEALLLEYEKSFVRDHDGRKYLLSADLPWIGERTNDPDGEHAKMLSEIENPVGIKIGPSVDEAQIESIASNLNPQDQPGKIIYTLRLGVDNLDKLPGIIKSIKRHDPEGIILSDPMHGNTVKLDSGQKTRRLSDISLEVKAAFEACKDAGIHLHGLHLEASGKENEIECVDNQHPTPNHKPLVDPQLNNSQLARVVRLYESLNRD